MIRNEKVATVADWNRETGKFELWITVYHNCIFHPSLCPSDYDMIMSLQTTGTAQSVTSLTN